MRIIKHRNGGYSLTDLTYTDLSDFLGGLLANVVPFKKGSTAEYVPSGYVGWSLSTYREVNMVIANRLDALADALRGVVYPLPLRDDVS